MTQKDVYQRMLETLGYPKESPYMARVIRKLMTAEEAEMLLRLPAAAEELPEKWQMDGERASAKVQEFLERGLLIPRKGKYVLFPHLRDQTLSRNPKYVDKELQDLFKEAWYKEEREHSGMKNLERTAPDVRVIPNRLALQKSPPPPGGVLPEEDVEAVIRRARRIVSVRCPCRVFMRNCDRPLHCFQFDRSADFNVNTGAGVELSTEAALAASDEMERLGTLHLLSISRFGQLCHCCGCCCIILDAGIAYGSLEKCLAKSRYQATLDLDLCTGCQDCLENCPCGAIEMMKAPGTKRLKAFVDPEKCWGCGACVVACSEGALTLKLVRTDDRWLDAQVWR